MVIWTASRRPSQTGPSLLQIVTNHEDNHQKVRKYFLSHELPPDLRANDRLHHILGARIEAESHRVGRGAAEGAERGQLLHERVTHIVAASVMEGVGWGWMEVIEKYRRKMLRQNAE